MRDITKEHRSQLAWESVLLLDHNQENIPQIMVNGLEFPSTKAAGTELSEDRILGNTES